MRRNKRGGHDDDDNLYVIQNGGGLRSERVCGDDDFYVEGFIFIVQK